MDLKSSDRSKRIFKFAFIVIILIASSIIIKDQVEYSLGLGFWGEEPIAEESSVDNENCNVSGVTLRGELVTYVPNENYDPASGNLIADLTSSEDVVYNIEEADKNEKIKAILLEIDSYGGSPVGAEEIVNALKRSIKPTVAVIHEGGTSAAYWVATGANVIFASKNSDVGGIGVTLSYLENVSKNQKEGLVYQQLSSGKFKDAGNPDKPLTLEEKALFMRDIKIIHENFMKVVAENRKLDINKVRALADGSTMLGELALQNGLIDQIGGQTEAEKYITDQIGEKIEICW